MWITIDEQDLFSSCNGFSVPKSCGKPDRIEMKTYQISNVSRGGGFLQLSSISTILEYKPHQPRRMVDINLPKRKTLEAIQDDGTFIKPLKQCFMRNPREGRY
jgi:hypothetical protein